MNAPFWIDYALASGGGLSSLQYLVGVGSFLLLFILSTLMLIFLPMKPDDMKRFFKKTERGVSAHPPGWERDILVNHGH